MYRYSTVCCQRSNGQRNMQSLITTNNRLIRRDTNEIRGRTAVNRMRNPSLPVWPYLQKKTKVVLQIRVRSNVASIGTSLRNLCTDCSGNITLFYTCSASVLQLIT